MNFRKGTGNRSEPEVNLIPFIDVLLVILIFLMVTTSYSRFTELHINLPLADAETARQRANEIHIGVDVRGNYKINQYPVARINVTDLSNNLSRVAQELSAGNQQSQPILIINADGSASHQSVIDILEAARLAGLSRITFATQQHKL